MLWGCAVPRLPLPLTPLAPAPHARRRSTVRVQAAKLPAGVTVPPKQPDVPAPKNGFVDNAERINSRAAMIGFFALLVLEAIADKGLLEILGFNVSGGPGSRSRRGLGTMHACILDFWGVAGLMGVGLGCKA